MIHSLRPSGRAIAVVTAIAVTGFTPIIAGVPAHADGPVYTHVKRKAQHKKQKQKQKQKNRAKKAAVQAPARLSLKTGGPTTPLLPGRTYTWPYSITNSSPARAEAVTFRTPMPSGLEFVSAQGDCSWAGGQAVCALGSLEKGQVVNGLLSAKVSQGAQPGSAVNGIATVDWSKGATSTSFPSSTIAPTADVVVTKSAPGTVLPGDAYEYELNVVNRGPAAAENVVLNDAIVPLTRKAGPVQITRADSACAVNSAETGLTCDLGTMVTGARQTIGVRVKLGPAVKPGTVIAGPALAKTPTFDVDLSNNDADSRTRVKAPVTAAASGLHQLPATGSDTQTMLDMALGLLGMGLILLRLGVVRRRRG
ncbi:LPXTG cell wall anchor domain-containing protein [Actinocorallia longicatena]|uniref:Gram-positive cocci surface proteins LPxTG domain-containing protein n=1 Tax=Actinocorallia longicatena TaxID=111803 RepID=A0ABP6QCI6_9ACTN